LRKYLSIYEKNNCIARYHVLYIIIVKTNITMSNAIWT